jgi:transposase
VIAADKQQAAQGAGLGRAELEELRRLRKENAELRLEKEILRKAARYFAKEMGR